LRRNAASWYLLSVLATALAACSGTNNKEPEADSNIVLANYKQEILLTLTRTLDDPTNLRDTYISDPVLTKVGTNQRYTACVRFNASDVRHSYTGSQDRIAYFYGGHLNQLVVATKEQCGNAAYKPFPELEKLCLANKCA
jgi:hypothetical protein